MDVDPPALDTGEPTNETSTTDLLGEEPVLNRDNPPEAADTLEDILDAVTAQPENPVAKINSEPLVENNEESHTNIEMPEKVPTSEANVDHTNNDKNLDVALNDQTVDNASGELNVHNALGEQQVENTLNEQNMVNTSTELNMEDAPNETNMENVPTESNGDNATGEQNIAMDTTDQVVGPNEKEANEAPVNVAESEKPATALDASPSKAVTPTFNLGVPGLKFSANNVKTAKDGTKMVQIHQSQITPDQLVALQNNPNIKVVFRHVPSGKSYSRAPRHLLPPGYSPPSKKRKADDDLDSSDVYKFDEGEDLQGPAKAMKYDHRFKFNHGSAKKKGKPRMFPDSSPYTSNYLSTNRQPGFPAQVMLTDLLARVNNPNAKKEIKVHTSQINAEVLANLELNPYYKIVLTTRQELPPLVIENVDAVEQAKLEKDAAEIEKTETAEKEEEEEEKMEVEQDSEEKNEKEESEQNKETEEEEKQRLEEEEKQKKEREAEIAKKMAEEEEELKKSVMQTQRSRSGRIRKPSKYALDIARLTKRKSVGTGGAESSGDESEDKIIRPNIKSDEPKEVSSPVRGRGRPKKITTPQPAAQAKQTIETPEKGGEEEIDEEASKKTVESDKNQTADESPKKASEPKQTAIVNEGPEKENNEDISKSEEAEKEVTSTENMDVDKSDVGSADQTPSEKNEDKNTTEPDTSTETTSVNETDQDKPADSMPIDQPEDSLAIDKASTDAEVLDENEIIDNKYRLRKLLEQCSTEEVRSVLLPEAFDSINIGDFLLYKAGQMHNPNGKVSFPKLYKEFEALHNDATKEASRYNTLVRRANKVGGDKRMEKIVLMPVYNIDAANSLQISNSSIDAHICGIQRTITTEMIAANSFFIKSKMDSPLIRLKLPEATAPRHLKPRQPKPLYTNQHQQPFANNRQEPDSTTPDKPKTYRKPTYGQKIASMKYSALQTKTQMEGLQVRRPAYIDQLKSTGQITLGGMSHQLSTKATNAIHSIPVDTSLLRADVQSAQVAASATSALAQMQATVQREQQQQQQAVVSTTQNVSETMALNPVTGELMSIADASSGGDNGQIADQAEQYFVTEDGVPITTSTNEASDGEVRKQLVPIGEGQYVELPEGYSLIQTDEGYIIGQPGSTFTQGEDGNVYITNSDGTTTEITREDIAGAGEDNAVVAQETEG